MKRIILSVAGLSIMIAVFAQDKPWSQRLAETAMKIWPDSFSAKPGNRARWSYDQGVILKGIEGIWNATGDGKWFRYIQHSMDYYVRDDGNLIYDYKQEDYNIDHVNNGKLLLLLYRVTGREKYKKAADQLRAQLKSHPRTSEGGFWHKKIYPYQMWLDGLYMGEPFYAEYAYIFHEDTAFNDIAKQFILMEKHSRDAKTGLLYHGWDESREQQWANKQTGTSPNFWTRSFGWYAMAIVDALDYFPASHPKRADLIAIVNRLATAVTKVQDMKSGVWYDVPNLPTRPKNYLEASGSCMLTYMLLKGVRKGYLPATFMTNAKKAYAGIIKEFIENKDGQVNLNGTVSVSGLGGRPYRDGSFDYYMSEPVVVNDPKGVGSFILCSVEMEMAATQSFGKGKTVVLDYYYNNEWKRDVTGQPVRWHYVWEDKSNSGYAMLGDIFSRYGAKIRSQESAPTAQNLKGASVYIIVDPDTDKETEKPNYMTPGNAATISEWVRGGGVLVLLSNDAGNAEFKNFNLLPKKFGVQFNEDSKNRVQNDQFEQGAVMTPAGHSVFGTTKKLYIKELSTLEVKQPASVILKNELGNIMAVAKYGKGTVFILGDPWIYNEYLDGRKLTPDFDNYKATEEWVKWLLKQAKK